MCMSDNNSENTTRKIKCPGKLKNILNQDHVLSHAPGLHNCRPCIIPALVADCTTKGNETVQTYVY